MVQGPPQHLAHFRMFDRCIMGLDRELAKPFEFLHRIGCDDARQQGRVRLALSRRSRDAMAAARRNPVGANAPPGDAQAVLNLYGTAKHALQLWRRRAAAKPEWAGAGIPLNVIALGFFDAPAAAPFLSDPDWSAAMGRLAPQERHRRGSSRQLRAAVLYLHDRQVFARHTFMPC